MRSWRVEAAEALAATVALAAITAVFFSWLHVMDATAPALVYLLVVLFVAASSRLWVAVAMSILAALALNFFFLPPIYTLAINGSEDWVAFITFIVVSVVGSRLSSLARMRQRELSRLFEFSRDALAASGPEAFRQLAGHVGDRFHLDYVAFFLTEGDVVVRHEMGRLEAQDTPDPETLHRVADDTARETTWLVKKAPGVFMWGNDARNQLWLVSLRHGPEAVGVLVTAGRRLEPTTLRALASVVAIAIARAHLLDEQQHAEVARRSVEIKSALLNSLTHDLRTPLTAIGAAVSNLGSPVLDGVQRERQSQIAFAGVSRLRRLFDNILEMAHLDAGGTAPSVRWVYLSEVIDAARKQVDEALRGRTIVIHDRLDEHAVHIDPRLFATALAHLLENAAQYSPAGSGIEVSTAPVSGGVVVHVDDHGPGIDADDESRIFDAFYRGSRAEGDRSGTGMGLAIVSGLMRAQSGRVSVENRESGGARFSLFVPAQIRAASADE